MHKPIQMPSVQLCIALANTMPQRAAMEMGKILLLFISFFIRLPPPVLPSVLIRAIPSSVFSGVKNETCVLNVPTGCVDAYKNADGWKNFLHIQDGSTAIRTITFDGKAYDIFDLNGRKVRENATTLDGLSKGMYIVNGRKYVVK